MPQWFTYRGYIHVFTCGENVCRVCSTHRGGGRGKNGRESLDRFSLLSLSLSLSMYLSLSLYNRSLPKFICFEFKPHTYSAWQLAINDRRGLHDAKQGSTNLRILWQTERESLNEKEGEERKKERKVGNTFQFVSFDSAWIFRGINNNIF